MVQIPFLALSIVNGSQEGHRKKWVAHFLHTVCCAIPGTLLIWDLDNISKIWVRKTVEWLRVPGFRSNLWTQILCHFNPYLLWTAYSWFQTHLCPLMHLPMEWSIPQQCLKTAKTQITASLNSHGFSLPGFLLKSSSGNSGSISSSLVALWVITRKSLH